MAEIDQNTPAMAPPAGEHSEFVNPPNESAMAIAIISILIFISTIVVALRLWTRFAIMRERFVGDYMLIVSYGLWVAEMALTIHQAATSGIFVHQWNVRLMDLVSYFRITLVLTTMYCVLTLVVKAAILIEFVRIFEPLGRRTWLWWISYGLIFANAVLYTIIVVFLNVACKTVTLTGSCTSEFQGWTTLCSAVVNFVTDVLIIFIPQYGIWKLNLSTRKKLGVAAVFFIGISGTLAAGLRLGYTVHLYQSEDFTYIFSQVVMCCASEGCCAMLVLCGPTLPRALSAMGLNNPFSSEGSKRSRRKQHSIKLDARPKNSNFNQAYDITKYGSQWSATGIIQTTEVETAVTSHESALNNASPHNVYDRQHPWEADQSSTSNAV